MAEKAKKANKPSSTPIFSKKNYRHAMKVLPVVLIIFVMLFAFYVRSGPVFLSSIDERIEANVYNNIYNNIVQDIRASNPNLRDVYVQELANERFQEVLDSGVYQAGGQSIPIDEIVESNVAAVKNNFQSEEGNTYLLAIDPYHFLGLSTNYALNGHTGTELREVNGVEVPWIDYKLAPNGIRGEWFPEFHIWLEAMLFKLNGVTEDTSVGERTGIVFLLPVIFAMLSVIPAFFIIRHFTNDIYATFGSLLMVSVSTFVSRTMAGFVDTDAYNVLFPLVVSVFLIYSLVVKNWKITATLALVAGLFVGITMWAWDSGWFIFFFLLLSLLIHMGYLLAVANFEKVIKRQFKEIKFDIRKEVIALIGFFVGALVSTYLFVGRNIFEATYTGITAGVSDIAGISTTNIWPNVLSSVAELNPASFASQVNSIGGEIVFFLAMLGLLFLSLDFKTMNENMKKARIGIMIVGAFLFLIIVQMGIFVNLTANSPLAFLAILFLPVGAGILLGFFNKNSDLKVFMAIFLSMWMAGTMYMSFNGVRFILLLAPALSIAFGFGLFYIAKILSSLFSKEMKTQNPKLHSNIAGAVLVTMLFAFIFYPAAVGAVQISENSLPNFDDAWYSSMDKIEASSDENAIITSWWDFGHFFAVASQRGVTFDGGSQATPRSHWVGKLFLESDEKVSADILRMLSCDGNGAFEYILEVSGDNTNGVKTNKLIYATLGKERAEKVDIIRNYEYYNFSEEEIEIIMSKLYCENPPENFVVTSEDMVSKTPVWAHWGSWDFTKKYVYDNYQRKSSEQIAQELDVNVSLVSTYVGQLEEIDIRSQSENINRRDLVNQWFAPYPGYLPLQNSYLNPCVDTNNTFVCYNGGLIINKTNSDIITNVNLPGGFRTLTYPSLSEGYKVSVIDPEGELDVVLVPSTNGPSILLAQAPLGTSLFTRLYYLSGLGSEYFEMFDNVDSMTGVKVVTWKANWEGNSSS